MINWLEKKRIFAGIMTLLIAVEIFYFSSIPGTKVSTGIGIIPIVYHFTAFFLLSFFMLITIKGKGKIKAKHLILVLLISIAYSVLDEIHQMFVPLRSSDINDILTDSAGIISALFLHVYMKKSAKD